MVDPKVPAFFISLQSYIASVCKNDVTNCQDPVDMEQRFLIKQLQVRALFLDACVDSGSAALSFGPASSLNPVAFRILFTAPGLVSCRHSLLR